MPDPSLVMKSLLLGAALALLAAQAVQGNEHADNPEPPSLRLRQEPEGGNGEFGDPDAVRGALLRALAAFRDPEALRRHAEDVERSDPKLFFDAQGANCVVGLGRWALGLARVEMWALQMVDASAKLVTGILYGNLGDLGNFDECVAAGTEDDTLGFSGRYVLTSLALQIASNASVDWPSGLLPPRPRPQQQQQQQWRSLRQQDDDEPVTYSKLAALKVGLCVPSACREPLLDAVMARSVVGVNAQLEPLGLRLVGAVPPGSTAVAGPFRRPDQADWAVIIVCAALVLLVLFGSIVDIALGDKAREARRGGMAVLLAFSAWTNGRRLLSVAPAGDAQLTCINGIRFLSAFWVVMGHRYLTAANVPYMNLLTVPLRITDPSTMLITSATLSVDTFFVMGGVVNCYVFMRLVQGRRSFNWVMYYVHRYIRLTPAFALMMAITATWITLLATGPMWSSFVGSQSATCQRNWWLGLLYVANYAVPNDQCMMQSWYLMADMQLHWLSPLLLYPLWKWRRVGVAWTVLVLLVSAAVPAALTYVNQLSSPIVVELDQEKQDAFMASMYYPMHTRATPYVFGILAGYFLHLVKASSLRIHLSMTGVLVGTALSTALCLSVVFGMQPMIDKLHHPYNVWEATLYAGLHRLAWSMGLSWVLLACALGYAGPVNALLSWTPLTVLGRLTYGIYLTHAFVQMMDIGTVRASEYYSDFKMVERTLSDGVLSTLMAACLTLCMESPVMALEKMIFRPSRKAEPRRPPAAGPQSKGGGVDNAAFQANDAVASGSGALSPFSGDPEKGLQHGDTETEATTTPPTAPASGD